MLEEVSAAQARRRGRDARRADVGFVDDTDDDDLEAPIEDFGLDEIKVPEVDFGNAPPGWVPPPGVARKPVSIELTGEEVPAPMRILRGAECLPK